MFKRAGFLLAIAGLLVSPALAEDDLGKNDYKWFFFHKEGVTEEVFTADYEFCSIYGSRVQPPRGPNVYTPGAIEAGVAGLFGGIQRSNQRRNMFRAVMRKCMAMKGYARYGLTEAEMDSLWNGGWDEAKTRVAVRAATPISTERRAVP
ncbi:MAG: hypothetical protein AAGI28_10850 [Pseudomonadota bacterium]